MSEFEREVEQRISANAQNTQLAETARAFVLASVAAKYSYNYSWLGRPIIQYPQDMVAMQELIWEVQPDLIIETGIAHGGSLVFSASMLTLLDVCDATQAKRPFDPRSSRRCVLGIDIDIRPHNRSAIEAHPMASRIQMIQGSSTDPSVVAQVRSIAREFSRVLVCLDSNHTHDHVLAELNAYADLTSVGSYCVVFDTLVEDTPKSMFPDRPWGPGDNPKTAVREFLKGHPEFAIESGIQHKLMLTAAPDGYLKRVS